MKYYAVRTGRKPGIYHTWDECKTQVIGFPGAEYKKFEDLSSAEVFMNAHSGKTVDLEMSFHKPIPEKEIETEKWESLPQGEAVAYVDGSFHLKDFHYSYGMVFLSNLGMEEFFEKFEDSELAEMRNVAGEIAGSMAAVSLALERGMKKVTIFYDYMGIEKWARGEWKTNKEGTRKYREFMQSHQDKIEISFSKVAAHTGVKYNERADELAKKALGIKK